MGGSLRRHAAVWFMTPLMLLTTLAGLARTEVRMEVLLDVPYLEVDGVTLTLDVYRAAGDGPHPALIAVHGGSWYRGDKSQWSGSAADLVGAGFTVFAIDYRLSPPGGSAGFGDALRDVQRAIGWVEGHASTYEVDPDAIGLIGSSAGAHLALLAGQREKLSGVRAVAAWSPPVNLAALAGGRLRAAIEGFIGCSVLRCPGRYDRMSPLHNVATFDPATFLANSTDELIPLKQVRSMARRLEGAGVTAKLVAIPGSAHGQQLRSFVLDDTISFFKTRLAKI